MLGHKILIITDYTKPQESVIPQLCEYTNQSNKWGEEKVSPFDKMPKGNL